ncbi:tRNA lysidine(34) synthetase TilS [Moraxella haemolytica]|uniref:tRNA lysidine(34) synthetase TilS n=1 Tax=Moraxella haemolytica TaxID=2904119 RepID=UPI002542F750|nr:tRNA lysidine(34) synthetase TilS [Moraxella sp. ZY171148]WII95057.1 tRNA lysidine(34) synthetase TilS [Moraxella sp. ZY171148]
MLDKLSDAFGECRDFLAHRRCYLACSGGRDSLALAFACKLLYEQGKIDSLPTILHIHHGWQCANDDWSKLVADWAVDNGFDCHVQRISLTHANETNARECRYQAMLYVMNDGDVLMLGHHAVDQAETLLMRLIDGAGVRGLSAMRTWQKKHDGHKAVWLWRPLLHTDRKSISRFAKECQLPYVDDPTNTDDAHVRGKLRNHVLPIFEQINPKMIQNIARSSQLLADADDMVQMLIDDKLSECNIKQLGCRSNVQVLSVDKVVRLPKSVQSALIHRWLAVGEPVPPAHRLIHDILQLIHRQDTNHQTRLFWQGVSAYVICYYQGYLYRYRQPVWDCLMLPAQSCNGLISSGKVVLKTLADVSLVWQVPDGLHGVPLQVVAWDRQMSIPFGGRQLSGKKFMQTLGLAAWLRQSVWVVYATGRPVLLVSVNRAWRLDTASEMAGVGAYFA